jgi:hypothetical protein
MITLEQYLGGLISSVTTGRALADMQSLKVAQDYARNSLLAHFPVPRMRIQNVEITVPVAVEELRMTAIDHYDLPDRKAFVSLVYNEILQGLGMRNLRRENARAVRDALEGHFDILKAQLSVIGEHALSKFASAVAMTVMEIAGGAQPAEPAVRARLAERLEKLAREQARLRPGSESIGSLQVTVEAHKLREQRPENLVHIKLSIVEEGVEWHVIEASDGTTVSKLLPE